MKNKLVCSMLVAAMCFGQLVSASATTVSDNEVAIEVAEEVQEDQEIVAETATGIVMSAGTLELAVIQGKNCSIDFSVTPGQKYAVQIYVKGSDTPKETFIETAPNGDGNQVASTIVLGLEKYPVGDYVIKYYLTDGNLNKIDGTGNSDGVDLKIRKSIKTEDNKNIKVPEISDVVYTGSDVEPTVVLKETVDGKEVILPKEAYKVTVVSDNKKEYGKAKVKIEGLGDYTGTVEGEFDIVPPAPTVSKVECTGYKSAKVTWTAVAGVDGYTIERKTGTGDFAPVGTVKGENTVSYTDESSENNSILIGKTYVYRVRAVKKVGSDYEVMSVAQDSNASVTIQLPAPELQKLESTASNKLKLSWKKVDGASGYRIYQVTDNGSLKKVKDVSATSYTITKDVTTKKSLVCGKTYKYTVKAYLKNPDNGNKTLGVGGKTLSAKAKPAAPKLVSVKTDGFDKVTIKWKEVSNAYGYYIYRKEANNEDASWKKIKTVKLGDTTSYVDAKAKTGVTYAYSVKAYTKVGGKKIAGEMNQTGKKATPLPGKTALKLAQTATGTGIIVRIANAQGADGYYIYRKQNNGSYQNYARIDAQKGDITTYTDNSIALGSTFEYYVVPFVEGESKRIKGTKSDKVSIYIK